MTSIKIKIRFIIVLQLAQQTDGQLQIVDKCQNKTNMLLYEYVDENNQTI